MSDINAYQRILPCRHAYSRKMDKSAVRVFALDDILGVAFDGSTLLPADALWLPRHEHILRCCYQHNGLSALLHAFRDGYLQR